MKILAIILGVAVIGGGVWYISTPKDSSKSAITAETSTTQVTSPTTDKVSNTPSGAVPNSPEELAKLGGQYKCTFTANVASADSSGTIYIDGKKFRGDFKSVVKAISMTIDSHSVSDGAYSYSWTASSPIGFKAPITASTDMYGAMSGSSNSNGANSNWNCVADTFGTDKFTLPTGIQFMEGPTKK